MLGEGDTMGRGSTMLKKIQKVGLDAKRPIV